MGDSSPLEMEPTSSNVNLFSNDKLIGADLLKNDMVVIGASNGGVGPTSVSAMLDLNEGDQVYLQKLYWMPNEAVHNKFFTSFSGSLYPPTL